MSKLLCFSSRISIQNEITSRKKWLIGSFKSSDYVKNIKGAWSEGPNTAGTRPTPSQSVSRRRHLNAGSGSHLGPYSLSDLSVRMEMVL
jgi:hypothetical protein